ncbi:MAG: MBL fold metallo-hydrolase [Dehalococcoidales bacterium]|nr:MBL fold metallo-hydrolase [Dehalococcoidales bacterium]
MVEEIKIITNPIVNCYLLKTGDTYFMVDAGVSFYRGGLKKALKQAGCRPGDIKLVMITHGDYDHTGNCAYLQKKYGARVAVHKSEAGALERGDMFAGRKNKQNTGLRISQALFKPLFFRKCKPDIFVGEGDDLSQYGIEGKIVHIPGHTTGSIGVLTGEGYFFCGDLLTNSNRPEKNKLVDDAAEMDASIEKMKALGIKTVYPGHGRPFRMEELLKKNP